MTSSFSSMARRPLVIEMHDQMYWYLQFGKTQSFILTSTEISATFHMFVSDKVESMFAKPIMKMRKKLLSCKSCV